MVSLIENDSTKYSTFTLAANALSEAISKAFPALPYHKPRRSIGKTTVPKLEIIGHVQVVGQVKGIIYTAHMVVGTAEMISQ